MEDDARKRRLLIICFCAMVVVGLGNRLVGRAVLLPNPVTRTCYPPCSAHLSPIPIPASLSLHHSSTRAYLHPSSLRITNIVMYNYIGNYPLFVNQ